jgi:hypothetical protein
MEIKEAVKRQELTMEQRLISAGIKTIYPPDFKFSRKEKRWGEVALEYAGHKIIRPHAQSCVSVCKKHFNLEI